MKHVPEPIEEAIEPQELESNDREITPMQNHVTNDIDHSPLASRIPPQSAPLDNPLNSIDSGVTEGEEENNDSGRHDEYLESDNEEAIRDNRATHTIPNTAWKRRSATYALSNPPTPTSPSRNGSFRRLKHFNPRYGGHMGSVQPQSLDYVTNNNTNENTSSRRYTYTDRKRTSFNIHDLSSAFRMMSRNRHNDSFSHRERRSPQPAYIPDDQELRTKKLASDLIASLLAGGPASLFAATNFLRDSKGHRRAPILLAMVDIKIKRLNDLNQTLSEERGDDTIYNPRESMIRRNSTTGSIISNRLFRKPRNDANNFGDNTLFELSIEYGIDDYRSKWKAIKNYGSMTKLHKNLKDTSPLKGKIPIETKTKLILPKFPRKKRFRQTMRSGVERGTDVTRSFRDSLVSSASSMSSTSLNSQLVFDVNNVHLKHLEDLINEPDDYDQPIEKRLERYFRLLNLALCLRPDANLLIRFYEFSTIGNLLSYEAGYKGKEGVMISYTKAKKQGWYIPFRTPNNVKEIVQRHTYKWCLVRDSYFMFVSDIFSTTPLEVFLVDSKFNFTYSGAETSGKNDDAALLDDIEWNLEDTKKISTKLFIKLENAERKLDLMCISELSMKLWVRSIAMMKQNCVWLGEKRFNSFAPVRKNVFAKFLVDGRDYFWSLSEALLKAEDVIYIHDWWLSPELYLRRPSAATQEHRLDRILKKKAEEGVKIFIIVYRNVGKTVGTDSLWTKHALLSLNKNVHVIRSPNQWTQNTYFWAHHEKFTVIDNTIAFMGGIDLCFGRYDTPDHALRDGYSKFTDKAFPGKDYSNARVADFLGLDKPNEDMLDRGFVCRMPWHDVHSMIIGEPARDLTRHFVQRWNYTIRMKRPSRPTPLLLPPIDFSEEELKKSPLFKSLNSKATCEIQILRSAGSWSLGLKETERSIQNAYLKLIEESEHYIYIENQFFVTTSEWDGVVVENKIGNAIVDRIIKAHTLKKPWKAIIIIPLMPGFDSPVDQPAASALRVIIQCQYQSISRGTSSIFGKLKKLGINPNKYIHFFSLRKWSRFGHDNNIRTEQLYVHAKLLIVDDRSCIIGSANINERSQLGNRDSEVAAIIRDTDTVNSKMNNKPHVAGKFALELRQKLMREHMGCDVDLVDIIERKFNKLSHLATLNYKTLHTLSNNNKGKKEQRASALIELGYRAVFGCDYTPSWGKKFLTNELSSGKETYGIIKNVEDETDKDVFERTLNEDTFGHPSAIPSINRYKRKKIHSFNYRAGVDNIGLKSNKAVSKDPRLINNKEHEEDLKGNGPDGWNKRTKEFMDSVTKQLQEWATGLMSYKRDFFEDKDGDEGENLFLPFKEDLIAYIEDTSIPYDKKWDMLKRIHYLQYLNHKENEERKKKHLELSKTSSITTSNKSEFSEETIDYAERDAELEGLLRKQLPPDVYYSKEKSPSNLLNLDFVDPYSFNDPLCPEFFEDMWFCTAVENTTIFRMVFHCQPDDLVTTWRTYKSFNNMSKAFEAKQYKETTTGITATTTNKSKMNDTNYRNKVMNSDPEKGSHSSSSDEDTTASETDSPNNCRSNNGTSSIPKERSNFPSHHLNGYISDYRDPILSKRDALHLLRKIKGHLVLFSTEWLSEELDSKNWFYNADRMVPIEIYD